MTDALPHDPYMTAVVGALAQVGIEPDDWWTEDANDGLLEAVIRWSAPADPDYWPHGVYLAWDQRRGWLLIEDGGGRNYGPVSPDVWTYADPRQVAIDTRNRLVHGPDGPTAGRITIDGPLWDPHPIQDAVKEWEAA